MIDTTKLDEFRVAKGWSEAYLAERMGLDYSYLYRLLRGQRSCGKKAIQGIFDLCESEGVDIYYFIKKREPEPFITKSTKQNK